MAEYISWRLNGERLPKVARISSSRAPVVPRRSVVEIPGRHGTLPGGLPVFGEATVTITTNPTAASQTDLEQAVTEVQRLLAQPKLILTRESGGITASSPAELVSITPGRHTPHMWAEITAVLALTGPFFVESEQVHGLPLAGQYAIDGLTGSSAPCSGVLRLAGPASAVSIVDDNSGTGVSWAGELAAGAFLFVRPRDLRAWLSADAEQWTPGGTDVSSGVDYPARGPLQLWPKIDGSVSASIVTEGTSEASALVLRAGRHFL